MIIAALAIPPSFRVIPPIEALQLNKQQTLLDDIAMQLRVQGYSINAEAVPASLAHALYQQAKREQLRPAGIGRQQSHAVDRSVRKDSISWITAESAAGTEWLAWADSLKVALNRQLLLGLFSFESHFAHYPPGGFYKKHVDAFKGEANRVLSMVVYLNPQWRDEDGGELVIYLEDGSSVKVAPRFATLVTFLSEEFPHEVLPAKADRYSIACWFRMNSSHAGRVDPPR
ncbi:2OG-Fe(II) oxygenase [Saccharophagus degradans]|uniref:2OG-Fe(II) oxygenase n=1 Tax=Saccharophagus degradans TaxID=86304 RepID=UPI002090F68D|nr:2OG-Fe(II) oxygenase [Saccharophagus degradans]